VRTAFTAISLSKADIDCRQGHQYSVLSEAIGKYMSFIDDDRHEDPVRAFFRLHIADIGKLIPYVRSVSDHIIKRMPEAATTVLSETNRVVLVRLNFVFVISGADAAV
jgi:nuclear pore complex protein Nup133